MAPKKDMPTATKEARNAKRERIAQVLEWLVAGVPIGEIQLLGMKAWGCTDRAVRNYITHCRRVILPSWYEWADQIALASELIAKLDSIYSRAMATGNLAAATRALKQQADLYGLGSAQSAVARASASDGDSAATVDGAPLEQLNAVRGLYGQRQWRSVDEYREWVASLAPQHEDKVH